jgi:hypothetical protein
MANRAPIMREREMDVRAIYLTEWDWDEFNAAQSEAYGSRLVAFRYGEYEIRSGQTSTIYSTHGVSVSVPKAVPDG